MSISKYELYQNDLFYLTKWIKELSECSPVQLCINGNIANIPWETRSDLMNGIAAVIGSTARSLDQSSHTDLVALDEQLACLPPPTWNARIDTVDDCILAFRTPEWRQIRDTCKALLPSMVAACAAVGMADYL